MKKIIFLEKMETKHPAMFSFYDYTNLPDTFLTVDKLGIRCPTHGIFNQYINDHLKGSGCPKCKFSKQRRTTETFKAMAVVVHGDRYDYSKSIYTTREGMVTIGCDLHGFFEQMAKSHLNGSGCPSCYGNIKDTAHSFELKAREVHGDAYDYGGVIYISSKDKVGIKCRSHGIFQQTPNGHLQGLGCPRCKESKGEAVIKSFLDTFNIPHYQEYKFEDSNYRYDFCLLDCKILIEFHGVQHYEVVEWFGGEEGFQKQVIRDTRKKELAVHKGFQLITLNYRQLKAGVLIQSIAKELKNLFRYWCVKSDELMVFRDSMEMASFFNVPYTPLDRVMVSNMAIKHPDVVILFS